jgi:hypothetical protein
VRDSGEGAQGVGVWVNGQDLDSSPFLIEHMYIEPLARQVQSDVQHGVGPPGADCIDNPTLSPVGPLFMTFNSVDLHGLHGAGIRLQERQPPFSHNCATREAGRVRVRAERTIAAQSPAR